MAIDLLGPANALNAVTARPSETRVFGAVDTFFKDCSAPDARDGTRIAADFLNGVMQQARRAIRGMEVTADNADDDMLLKAIKSARLRYAVDTGAANALIGAFDPPVASLYDGLIVAIKVANDNTNNVTLKANGLAAKPLLWPDGAQIAAGGIKAGMVVVAILTNSMANYQVVSAFRPNEISLSDFFTFNNVQTWATAGSFTFTVPAGVYRLWVKVKGAGGGSGGGGAIGGLGGFYGGAGGEGGTSYALIFVTPGQVINLTVGAPGLGGPAGTNGTSGNSSSFGPLVSATGGNFGIAGDTGAAYGIGGEGGHGLGGLINLQGKWGDNGSLQPYNAGSRGGNRSNFDGGQGGDGATPGNSGYPGLPGRIIARW